MGEGQGQGMGQGQSPQGLGTGFVPNSPEVTAQQIAGQAANAAAQAALGQAQGQGQGQQGMGQGQGEGQQPGMGEGQGSEAKPGANSSTGESGGVSQKGNSTDNQKSPDKPLDLKNAPEGDSRGEKAAQDANTTAQKFEKEPWFTKLPPNLRKAIEAKSRREAPRGYEERLRRYFESTD